MDRKVRYLPSAKSLALLTCLVFSFSAVMQTAAETIHRERSIYRDITVVQNGNRRCLVFNVHRGDRNQTCVEMNDRDRLVFSYTRMSFAGLLLQPQPKTILVAGLGGDASPMLRRSFPGFFLGYMVPADNF